MAKAIVSKNVTAQSANSGRVVYQVSGGAETLVSDSDFSFDTNTVDQFGVVGKTTYKMVPRKIVKIINAGATKATIDGKVYNAGANLDFSESGGIDLATAGTCAITFATDADGNVIIEFRS